MASLATKSSNILQLIENFLLFSLYDLRCALFTPGIAQNLNIAITKLVKETRKGVFAKRPVDIEVY